MIDWVRNSAKYVLDCMKKPLEIKNSPGGGPLYPFTVNYFFGQILTPPPLNEKLDLPLYQIKVDITCLQFSY